MDHHQKVLVCDGAQTHQCRRQVWCRNTRSWDLLQLGDHELIQASCINWSPNGGGGTKFRGSQPVSHLLQDKAWCAWHGAIETLGVFPPLSRHCVALGRLQSLWHRGLIQSGKFCSYLLLAALFQWSVTAGKTSLQEREET